MTVPAWFFWAFLAVFVVVAIFVLRQLLSGEIVGSIEGKWFKQMGGQGIGNARVLVRRQGAQTSGLPTVQLQVRVIGMMQGCLYTPSQARELADLLDAAARKVDPR